MELRDPCSQNPLATHHDLSGPQAVDTSSPFCHPQGTDLIQALDVCDLVVGGSRWCVGIGIEWGVWGLQGVVWGLRVVL